MPWSSWVNPENRLTGPQRYFYLFGGLLWFTDLFNLIFASFLVLGGLFSLAGGQITIRPLTSTMMILPAVFLLIGLLRFVWVLRHALKLSWGVALRSMYNFFSLGWTVALACIQGLIQPKGAFLRTPKSRSNSRIRNALTVTRWETLIGMTCLAVGGLAFAVHPESTDPFSVHLTGLAIQPVSRRNLLQPAQHSRKTGQAAGRARRGCDGKPGCSLGPGAGRAAAAWGAVRAAIAGAEKYTRLRSLLAGRHPTDPLIWSGPRPRRGTARPGTAQIDPDSGCYSYIHTTFLEC